MSKSTIIHAEPPIIYFLLSKDLLSVFATFLKKYKEAPLLFYGLFMFVAKAYTFFLPEARLSTAKINNEVSIVDESIFKAII